MSLKLERWMRNTINGPKGRWVMLGLLIFILVVFTVTSQMSEWLRGVFGIGNVRMQGDVAGSFSILPGDVTQVDHVAFEAARNRFRLAQAFLLRVPMDRVSDLDVWTHLVLLEAAKREHVSVSEEDLRALLQARLPDYIAKDPSQYRKWVQENFGASVPTLEAAIADFVTAFRVRQLYQESFLVAPATTRETAVQQAANQNVEFAYGSYAALDAGRFLKEAEEEIKSESDPEAKLRDFYDKDPSLALETQRFRHPDRFVIEVLYTIHKNVDTDEKLQQMKDLVLKAYPDAKLAEPTIAEGKSYYGIYRDRLLKMAGQTFEAVREAYEKEQKKAAGKDGTAKDEQKTDEQKADGETKEEEKKDDTKGEAKDEKKDDEKKDKEKEIPQELKNRIYTYGYDIVKDQVRREVWVRTIYDFLYTQTKDKQSLKVVYDKLKAEDDPEHPVCSTEPGKGLFEYRDFDGKPLTGDEIEDIEDSGVKFGFSFRPRVSGLKDATDLPKMEGKPDTLGDGGFGRQVFRLLEVIRARRKKFEELTAGEKDDLKNLFYLPAQARERAKEKLEALRKQLVDGSVKPEQFRAAAEALGARVHEDEWIEASYETVSAPDKKELWPDEFLHMRDRYFLKRSLAQTLDRDRAKPEDKRELKPPCFLPVDTDTREEAQDPGSAYLFHLLDRQRPDATTITATDLSRYLRTFANQRLQEEQDRWTNQPEQLIADFRMHFDPEMQARIDDDLRREEETRKKGMR
jgi:hypothetical protein